VTFQVVTAKHRPLAGMRPRIDTLLDDYQCHALPSTLKATLTGHSGSVKVVHFVGDQARLFALNCSPSTVRLNCSPSTVCPPLFALKLTLFDMPG
jgi:hypothetical protein